METNTEANGSTAANSAQMQNTPIQGNGSGQPVHKGGDSDSKSSLVRGGVAQINVVKLERHISNEVQTYSKGGFPRQSERYYKLMSVLHIARMLFHDGHCLPIHREFYKRLAQIHHQQQQKLQQQSPQQPQQQQVPFAR
ncbi:hypothetical protein H4R20_004880 [Coemansia guatemalensis]|uniref:Uncharacterized protein n=1 Tax=Coemansia guatemalensis TaxID=2761395 RepID=A0A9W8HVD4_9FUNG|nr:hypothetical protein H4R20_004880 [Coemansia guatemalensis]